MIKKLYIDIETSPHMTYSFNTRKAWISHEQIIEPSRILCFAAQMRSGAKLGPMEFFSEHHDGRAKMIKAAHSLLSSADIAVHYNGIRFDEKHLNREFVALGRPAPFQSLDLFREVRRNFELPHYSLRAVSEWLGVGTKVRHQGFELWPAVMSGDEKAWRLFRRYCIGDVRLLPRVEDALRTWIKVPNAALHHDQQCVSTPGCKGTLFRNGHRFTINGRYQRYQCRTCRCYSTASRRDASTEIRPL